MRIFCFLVLCLSISSCGRYLPKAVHSDYRGPSSQSSSCKEIHRELPKHARLINDVAMVDSLGNISSASNLASSIDAAIRRLTDDKIEKSAKTLLLFVHGRGKHPGKLFNKELICGLAVDNKAEVIAFHWPSYAGPLGYPQWQAYASADAFSATLSHLNEALPKLQSERSDVKLVLLTHSMGSYVLEKAVLNHALPERLFDTLVINAPASETEDSTQWLSKLKLAKSTYVVVNPKDKVLRFSEVLGASPPLGRYGCDGSPPPIPDVNMINIGQLDVNHRYYLQNNTEGPLPEVLGDFFRSTLAGQPHEVQSNGKRCSEL